MRGYSITLSLRSVCRHRKVIVVGDIHGCFDQFMALLEKCDYSRGNDIVVATGDLVDRGPKIRETLLWFGATSGVYSVMGNHDNKAMRYWRGNPVSISNGLDKTIAQTEDNLSLTNMLARWISVWPHMIRLANMDGKPVYVVHAGVDGRQPIDRQRIETCLYARYFDGKDFFDEQGILWWKTLTGDYTVISGHIRTDDVHPCEHAYCIDGGAHEGRKLRALVIINGEVSIHEV